MVCCECCQGYAMLCRVFAHGWLIAAVILSASAASSCEFITRDETAIGLYRFQRPEEECIAYRDASDFSYGWLHDWARVCGVLAPISGGLVVILMFLDCCCNVCCSKYMQTFLIVCCELNQGFTFLIYASNACLTRKGGEFDTIFYKGCRPGDGSALSFFAFWFYFIGGFFILCSPKPNRQCGRKDNDDDNNGKKKKSDDKPAVQEDDPKPKEEEPATAAAVAKKEEKPEQPEETKDIENTKEKETPEEKVALDEEAPAEKKVSENQAAKEEEKNAAIPDKETSQEENAAPDEEAPEQNDTPEEDEAPAVAPAIVPAVTPGLSPPPPIDEEAGMEIELDEEFGTSQTMPSMYR